MVGHDGKGKTMPLYEYRCEQCDRTFERRHGWDDRVTACPDCASSSVRRLLPTFAVVNRASSARAQTQEADPYECTPMGCERPGCASRVN